MFNSTKNPDVLWAISRNANATPEILTQLATNRSSYVKSAVAKHPNTPPEVLAKLAFNRNSIVQLNAKLNPHLPQELKDRFFGARPRTPNKWEKGIKKALGVPDNLASTIYDWYDAEGAFEDFSTVSEFVDFLRDDIYNMLDACTDAELRREIGSYVGYDIDEDEDF